MQDLYSLSSWSYNECCMIKQIAFQLTKYYLIVMKVSRLKYCQIYNWKQNFTYCMDIFRPSEINKGVHKIGFKQSGVVAV